MEIQNFQVETSEAGYNVRRKTNLATNEHDYFMVGMVPMPLTLPNGSTTIILKEQEFPLENVKTFEQVIPAIEKLIEEAERDLNKPKLITPGNGGLSLVN